VGNLSRTRFRLKFCLYVVKSCQMINTVAQEVLGRNPVSPSVDQVLGSSRTRVFLIFSHLASSTIVSSGYRMRTSQLGKAPNAGGLLNSNIHPCLRVVHVGNFELLCFLLASILPRKRSCIVTFSEHWNYFRKAIANRKRYTKKKSFGLQNDFMHAGMNISSNTVRRCLLEAGRTTNKPLKSSFLFKK